MFTLPSFSANQVYSYPAATTPATTTLPPNNVTAAVQAIPANVMPAPAPVPQTTATLSLLNNNDTELSVFEHIMMLAVFGERDAQLILGQFYEFGEMLERNMPSAVKWYQAAANNGNAEAQYRLGLCYEMGDGVDQNSEKALKLFRTAAAQGYPEAIRHLRQHEP
ncbi:HCP-like protein [Rhizoclosmatium globosum]|uniref:HCP-like protein n=1 Tax=Rhizoclosmatium globosum TaxID=329046 RepID=A0A1Y2BS41_9FUNG|nr:HCP-like protein [Rhizoclosmatium globosum]|eukprot:ORY37569.1 HCP-like protein [Rhizoclosmatium globosum]